MYPMRVWEELIAIYLAVYKGCFGVTLFRWRSHEFDHRSAMGSRFTCISSSRRQDSYISHQNFCITQVSNSRTDSFNINNTFRHSKSTQASSFLNFFTKDGQGPRSTLRKGNASSAKVGISSMCDRDGCYYLAGTWTWITALLFLASCKFTEIRRF